MSIQIQHSHTYIIHIRKGLREFALMYEETELNVHLYIPIYKKKLCIYTNLTAAYIITMFAFLRLLMMSYT